MREYNSIVSRYQITVICYSSQGRGQEIGKGRSSVDLSPSPDEIDLNLDTF